MTTGHTDFAVVGIEGVVALIDDIPFCIEDWDMPWSSESIEYVNCATGQIMNFPTKMGAELTLMLKGLNTEGRALLQNGTITTGGNTPFLNEEKTPVANTYTLTNVPILDGSLAVRNREGNVAAGRVTVRMKRVTGACAVDDEFSYVAATGVVTVNAAFVTPCFNYYTEVQAATGKKLTHSFGVDSSTHDLVIMNGLLNRQDNTFDPDGYSISYPAVTILTKPSLGGQIDDLKELESVFTVLSPPVESFPK